MALGGYEKAEGKRSGGIRSLALVAACNVLDAVLDGATGICTDITLKQGAAFCTYGFKEGEAYFTEELSVSSGIVKARHEIAFSLERPDGNSVKAITELAQAAGDGIVAIVTTNSNVSFLVGYSDKFAVEQPLRLVSAKLATGAKFGDDTCETATLVSQDDSKAIVYAGSVII